MLCKKWNKTDEAKGRETHGISQLRASPSNHPGLATKQETFGNLDQIKYSIPLIYLMLLVDTIIDRPGLAVAVLQKALLVSN